MLRKLLILACMVCTQSVIAQVGKMPPKNTQKAAEDQTDYKEHGAPMPEFLMIAFHDTSAIGKERSKHNRDSIAATRKVKRTQRKENEQSFSKHLIANKDIDNGANLFVMMFNPTCGHCQEETEMIEKNMDLFKKSKLVLLANMTSKPYVPDFVKSFHTDDFYPNIQVGVDSIRFMDKVYLYGALPQITIYDGHRKLIKTYNGEVPIDSLKPYIQ